jgi:hypothetical protein
VCLFGSVLRIANLTNVQERNPDERVYAAFAGRLLDDGPLRGERSLAAEYLHRPESRLYPPPSRIGYIGLMAAAMSLGGTRDPRSGAWVSCLASIAALALAIRIGWYWFSPWTGVLAGLLLSVYPADLALSRRAWTDSLVIMLTLAMIGFALPALMAARRPSQMALVVTGSFALLVKESSALVFGVCVLWVAWALWKGHGWPEARRFLAIAAAGLICATACLSLACGGTENLTDIIGGIPAADAANRYAVDFAAGQGYRFLLGFWTVSPAVSLLSLAGLAAAFSGAPGMKDKRAAVAIAWFTVGFGALPMVLPHWLNLRYAAMIFAPLCLLSAAAIAVAAHAARRMLPGWDRAAAAILAAVALLLVTAGDYGRFRRVWVDGGLPDLSTRMLLGSVRNAGGAPICPACGIVAGHAIRRSGHGAERPPVGLCFNFKHGFAILTDCV